MSSQTETTETVIVVAGWTIRERRLPCGCHQRYFERMAGIADPWQNTTPCTRHDPYLRGLVKADGTIKA